MIQTPADIRENTPGYEISLDPETFKWRADPITPGLPAVAGSKELVIKFVASEQGWCQVDLAETLADAHNPARSGW